VAKKSESIKTSPVVKFNSLKETAGPGVLHLLLSSLVLSKTNPRRHNDAGAMQELTTSVKARGILVPLLVRPITTPAPTTAVKPQGNDAYTWEIICGSRRYLAAKAAGLESVPVQIKHFNDDEAMEIQVIENLQRADIHALDEAYGYQMLLKRGGNDPTTLAAKVGKTATYIHRRLKLCDLIKGAQEAFLEDKIYLGHALLLCRLQPLDQEAALKEITGGYHGAEPEPIRYLQDWIESNLMLDLHRASFSKTDGALLKPAGSCQDCPKRTGSQPTLFPDIKRGDTCTDKTCFALKQEAHIDLKRQEFAAAGETLLDLAGSQGSKGTINIYDSHLKVIEKPKDSCACCEKGIMVESAGGHVCGAILTICQNKACKQHHGRGNGSGNADIDKYQATQKSAEHERKQLKVLKERVDRRAREAVLRVVDKEGLSRRVLHLIGNWMNKEIYSEYRRVIAKELALEPLQENKTKGGYQAPPNYEKTLALYFDSLLSEKGDLTAEELQQTLHFLCNLALFGWDMYEDSKTTTAVVAKFGIDRGALEKQVMAEMAETKTLKTAGKKVKKIAGKQNKQTKPKP